MRSSSIAVAAVLLVGAALAAGSASAEDAKVMQDRQTVMKNQTQTEVLLNKLDGSMCRVDQPPPPILAPRKRSGRELADEPADARTWGVRWRVRVIRARCVL